MRRIRKTIDNLSRSIAELYVMIRRMEDQENKLMDMYLEINRLQHRVKELEDDGK